MRNKLKSKGNKQNKQNKKDNSKEIQYKLTDLIKISKDILDVLLVLICYQNTPSIQKKYPIIYKIQTVCLICVELLLSKSSEVITYTNDDPLIINLKRVCNKTIINMRKVILVNPRIKKLLKTVKDRDSLTTMFISIYEELYYPVHIFDVFEESNNPDKEAISVAFKFLLVMINMFNILANTLPNLVSNFFFISPIIKKYVPQIITSTKDGEGQISIDIFKILNLDFSVMGDKYSRKILQYQENFNDIRNELQDYSNINKLPAITKALKFIIDTDDKLTVFDTQFFEKKFNERFKGGLICAALPTAVPTTVPVDEVKANTDPVVAREVKPVVVPEVNPVQVGGSIHKDTSTTLDKVKYSNINNFISTKSLEGLFLLHNYNKYYNN